MDFTFAFNTTIIRLKLTDIYSAGQKKLIAQKGYFWVQKNVLYIIFFFSCLKMVIYELVLLELGDLLGSSLLRNFFVRQGQYISIIVIIIVGQFLHLFGVITIILIIFKLNCHDHCHDNTDNDGNGYDNDSDNDDDDMIMIMIMIMIMMMIMIMIMIIIMIGIMIMIMMMNSMFTSSSC